MAYKIVFFDIDGTLLDEDKKIPDSTKEAIEKLKAANVHVVIATGRSPYHLQPIAEELGIDSFVSFNGSYVVHQGKVIYERDISPQTIRLLDEFAFKNNHPLVYLGNQAYFASHEQHPHILQTFDLLQLAPPDFLPRFWKENKIYQVMLYCESDAEQAYIRNFMDVDFVRWHPLSMDVVPPGGSKAKGIESMLNILNISPDAAVAFGDALNDREMLAFVGMGIAMGNSHPELLPYANFKTKHVNEGGIQYGLQQIGLI